MGFNKQKSLAVFVGALTVLAFQNCKFQDVLFANKLSEELASIKSLHYSSSFRVGIQPLPGGEPGREPGAVVSSSGGTETQIGTLLSPHFDPHVDPQPEPPELSLALYRDGEHVRAILTTQDCEIDAEISPLDFVEIAARIKASKVRSGQDQALREPWGPNSTVRIDHEKLPPQHYRLNDYGLSAADEVLEDGETIENRFLDIKRKLEQSQNCQPKPPVVDEEPAAVLIYHRQSFPLSSTSGFYAGQENDASYPLTSTSVSLQVALNPDAPKLSGKIIKYEIQRREDLEDQGRWVKVCENSIAEQAATEALAHSAREVRFQTDDIICMIGRIYLGPGEEPSITKIDRNGRALKGGFGCWEATKVQNAERFLKELDRQIGPKPNCLDQPINP